MDDNFNPALANEHAESVAHHDAAEGGFLGAFGGAVVGGLAGGPLGAVIGAVVGGVASAAAVDVVDNLHHEPAQSISVDKADAGNHKSDINTPHIPTPNIAYYTAPGAFGTSLPGIFAPPVIDDSVTNADKDSASINTEAL